MITQEQFDKKLVAFALSIKPDFRGFYAVSHLPERNARVACCFQNVKDKIDRSGGEIYYGWTFSHRVNPECGDYLIANHHAVWRAPHGRLVDLTPFAENINFHPINQNSEVLFLPDEAAVPVVQGRIIAPLADQFFAIGEDTKILDYVRTLREKEERECAQIYKGDLDPNKVLGLTMELKEKTSRALATWIGRDTWYSNHDLDMRRFYNFVDQYQQEHGTSLDESAMLQEISERLQRGGRFTEALQDIARTRVSLAVNILEFLEAREQ